MSLADLYQLALDHRLSHGCSAYPYENYQKLADAVNYYQAKNILEIGTGMGFSSTVMALQNSDIHIDTIEKDSEHASQAKQFHEHNNVAGQITIYNSEAEQQLAELASGYDLIFFDGFQIHYEFLPHYERLLKTNGILFLANNQLDSKTSDQFFDQLHNSGKWKILEQFADTTVAQKI